MKRIAFLSMFLALGLFASGCGDTATKKDKTTSETKVTTDKDTGEESVKNTQETSHTDSATGAEEKSSIDEEHTSKPAQDGDNDLDGGAATDPVDDATTVDDDKARDADGQ